MHNKHETLSNSDLEKIYLQARQLASNLINLPNPELVIFGRNATEAASLFYWLADIQKNDNVIISNAEHDSIKNVFQYHQDHGNDRMSNNKSSWPYWFFKEKSSFETMDNTKTGIEIRSFNINDTSTQNLSSELSKVLDDKTKVLVLSHVRRDTGQAVPIEKIIKIAKKLNPNLKILIDGTQALGNLPKIDITKLNCDAYLASPHKTMNSEVLGIMFLNPSTIKLEEYRYLLQQISPTSEQKIVRGMLDPVNGITPNSNEFISPADVMGFIDAVTRLHKIEINGNNFLNSFKKRLEVKDYLITKINQIPAFSLEFVPVIYQRKSKTPFILNMKIIGLNSYDLARTLSRQNIFITSTYDKAIPDDKFLRISFQPNTTKKEINYFVAQLQELIKQK
jgi:selenocysteine lyase/cysteine desulfurase